MNTKTETTPEEQPREDVLLVCLGQRINSKEKLVPWWLEVSREQFEEGFVPTKDWASPHYRVYTGKEALKRMAGSPGSVYKVPQIIGTTQIYTGDARYQGQWPDDAQRFQWQTEHRQNVTEMDLIKRAKKEGGEEDFAPLRPLREKYTKLVSRNQKAALLAQVIAFITGGK